MTPELDERLCKDFPLLFRDRHGSPMETSMCWGFPGDGWYALIREACEELEPILETWYATASPEDIAAGPPRASQVKEKLGGLRFYLTDVPEELYDRVDEIVRRAEDASMHTCEDCGEDTTGMEECPNGHRVPSFGQRVIR
jgi:hypothetical protein